MKKIKSTKKSKDLDQKKKKVVAIILDINNEEAIQSIYSLAIHCKRIT